MKKLFQKKGYNRGTPQKTKPHHPKNTKQAFRKDIKIMGWREEKWETKLRDKGFST